MSWSYLQTRGSRHVAITTRVCHGTCYLYCAYGTEHVWVVARALLHTVTAAWQEVGVETQQRTTPCK